MPHRRATERTGVGHTRHEQNKQRVSHPLWDSPPIDAGADGLEAVPPEGPCGAFGLIGAAHAHVSVKHTYVAQIGALGQIASELMQGGANRATGLVRPGDGWAAASHQWNVLIPQVQGEDRGTRAKSGTVGEYERVVRRPQLEPKHALRFERILEDAA